MKFQDMPYERVNVEDVTAQFAALEKAFDEASSGEEQFAVHQRYYTLTDHIYTQMTLAHIRHDIDVTDEFYSREQDYYDSTIPVFTNLVVNYQKKLYHSRYRAYLEQKIGPVAFKNMELAMRSVDERILNLLRKL